MARGIAAGGHIGLSLSQAVWKIGSACLSRSSGMWQAIRWPSGGLADRRRFGVADRAELARAAAGEAAAGAGVERAADLALEPDALLRHRRIGHRHRREQGLGVGVERRVEQRLDRPALHHLAEIHDDDLVGEVAHECQVVTDEDHRLAVLSLDPQQQVDHRRLHRHVQRGNRLIGDQQVGVAGKGAGDGDALLLPARELARQSVAQRGGQAHHFEQVFHPPLDVLARPRDAEFPQRARDRGADGMRRVQRAVGILEHHLDRGDVLGRAAPHRNTGEIDAVETDLPAGRAIEAGEDAGEGRFAGTGFADDRDDLAAIGGERDLVVGHQLGVAKREDLGQIAHFEDALLLRPRSAAATSPAARSQLAQLPPQDAAHTMRGAVMIHPDRADIADAGDHVGAARGEGAALAIGAGAQHDAGNRRQRGTGLVLAEARDRAQQARAYRGGAARRTVRGRAPPPPVRRNTSPRYGRRRAR